jgi:type IV pilus assembly protein PilA
MRRVCQLSAAGFTLVELLVVIAIVSILASVAVTQYATYKQKAVDADMLSTLRSGRTAMEGLYVGSDPLSYASATEALLPAFGYRASPTVNIKIVAKSDNNYTLRVCATGGSSAAYIFDSTVGVAAEDSGSCT